MRNVLLLLFLFIVINTKLSAQENLIFPKGTQPTNPHTVGDIWLNELFVADSIFKTNIAYVNVAAGARLDWHKHPGGQILLIVDGEGYYQEKELPRKIIRKGDVIKCLPNIEHWHGATPHSSVAYIASVPMQNGKTIWLHKVSDSELIDSVGATQISHNKKNENQVLAISKIKWRLMAEKKVDSLATLFNDKSVFVHMGGNMTKAQELDVIRNGTIHYKHTEIQETTIQLINNTAIILNKIRLTAVVNGVEVINPFTVTEVYIKDNELWTIASLSFTKLLVP